MNNDFPRMVFKLGGPHEIHGGRFDYLIVEDAESLDTALATGWTRTTDEARAAAAPKAAPAAADTPVDDNAPPTRDELKQKATELGLTFAGNISTEKLAALVEAAVALKD